MNLSVWRAWIQARFGHEQGAGLVEYILLVSFIAMAVIAAVILLRDQVSSKFSEAGSAISRMPNN